METAATPVASARGAVGARAAVSDERLMARVRSGDDEAFGWIYDRYAGSLLAFCHHMLGTREEAEDALQHVFVAAHRQMRFASPPQQLKPWLYAVARNRCLSVLRSRRDMVALDDVLEPAAGADVSRAAEQREDIREVLADVAALPYEQREALILAEVGALSHEEIATALGVRKDKVKALVFRARKSLMVSREARETTCRDIQEQLSVLHGGALRRGALRRHVDHCPACAAFKGEVQRQRSLLAAALPVLPAAALKPTILAAAHAGAAGGGVAAAGGITAVAATAGSSSAVGGGLTGLGSSALLTKVLAVGAVASIAVGGGTAVVRLEHGGDQRAADAASARPAPKTPATQKAASISAISLVAAPSGRPASNSGGADPQAGGRRRIAPRAPGQRGRGPAAGPAVGPTSGATGAIGIEGPKVPQVDLGPRVSVAPESAESGSSAGQPNGAAPGSSEGPSNGAVQHNSVKSSTDDSQDAEPGSLSEASDSAESGSPAGGSDDDARPASPPGQSHSSKPASPPGQSNSAKPASPPGQANSAKPASPPGQSNSAKPASPPGQANSAKPDSPPGQANEAKPASPPGQANSVKPDSPPGQANDARPEPSAEESNSAKPASPPGQANSAKPDSPPGQAKDAASAS